MAPPRLPKLVGGTPEALARAKAMGFDIDTKLYHGTTKDFDGFRAGSTPYVTTSPSVAGVYAKMDDNFFKRANGNPLKETAPYFGLNKYPEGANLKPVFKRGKYISEAEFNKKYRGDVQEARRSGVDGYSFKVWSPSGGFAERTRVFDPKNLRSTSAAFDPAKKDSSDLLASFAPYFAAGGATAATAAALNPQQASAAPVKPSLLSEMLAGLGGKKPPAASSETFRGFSAPGKAGPRGSATWHSIDRKTAASYGDATESEFPLGRVLEVDARYGRHHEIPVSGIADEKLRLALGGKGYVSAQTVARVAKNIGAYDSVRFSNMSDLADDKYYPTTVVAKIRYAAPLALGAGSWALGANDKAEAAPLKLPTPKGLHVSPYDFNKFDISKIGSGEGSQVFGHGLYFTDKASPNVADYYRDFFSKRGQSPITYETDLGVDPSKLADWNTPIIKQSKTIQNAFSDLYQMPKSKLSGGQTPQPIGADESAFLNERGVPGLQYDAGSLWGGGGGKNYVMFDDKPLNIIKKYAAPFAVGATAAGAAMQPGQASAAPPKLPRVSFRDGSGNKYVSYDFGVGDKKYQIGMMQPPGQPMSIDFRERGAPGFKASEPGGVKQTRDVMRNVTSAVKQEAGRWDAPLSGFEFTGSTGSHNRLYDTMLRNEDMPWGWKGIRDDEAWKFRIKPDWPERLTPFVAGGAGATVLASPNDASGAPKIGPSALRLADDAAGGAGRGVSGLLGAAASPDRVRYRPRLLDLSRASEEIPAAIRDIPNAQPGPRVGAIGAGGAMARPLKAGERFDVKSLAAPVTGAAVAGGAGALLAPAVRQGAREQNWAAGVEQENRNLWSRLKELGAEPPSTMSTRDMRQALEMIWADRNGNPGNQNEFDQQQEMKDYFGSPNKYYAPPAGTPTLQAPPEPTDVGGVLSRLLMGEPLKNTIGADIGKSLDDFTMDIRARNPGWRGELAQVLPGTVSAVVQDPVSGLFNDGPLAPIGIGMNFARDAWRNRVGRGADDLARMKAQEAASKRSVVR